MRPVALFFFGLVALQRGTQGKKEGGKPLNMLRRKKGESNSSCLLYECLFFTPSPTCFFFRQRE